MGNVEWGPTLANKALFGFPLASTISAGSEYPLAAVLTFSFLRNSFYASPHFFPFYNSSVPLSSITGVSFLAVPFSGPGYILPESFLWGEGRHQSY